MMILVIKKMYIRESKPRYKSKKQIAIKKFMILGKSLGKIGEMVLLMTKFNDKIYELILYDKAMNNLIYKYH